MKENTFTFDEVYNNYKDQIHRYLMRMVGPDEAKDLTQEVFVKVYKSLSDFKGNSNISTWIYKIATNTAIDRLRSASYKNNINDNIPDESLVSEDQSPWEGRVLSIDQQLIEKEMNDCIRNFINKLSENYRSVLVLSELECLKNTEIAEILNLSLDTVKVRLHRARASLREVLKGNCNFYHTPENKLA